jgi:hypothetical protein
MAGAAATLGLTADGTAAGICPRNPGAANRMTERNSVDGIFTAVAGDPRGGIACGAPLRGVENSCPAGTGSCGSTGLRKLEFAAPAGLPGAGICG